MTKELMEALKAYRKKFGEGFPTIPLAWGREDEEVIAMIDHCIAEGKTVYELGILPDPMTVDILY
nr:MAG TPA: OHCU decarboxylase [Caudoviricetes sp.]